MHYVVTTYRVEVRSKLSTDTGAWVTVGTADVAIGTLRSPVDGDTFALARVESCELWYAIVSCPEVIAEGDAPGVYGGRLRAGDYYIPSTGDECCATAAGVTEAYGRGLCYTGDA